MSACAEWKAGMITDNEYAYLCRQEQDEDWNEEDEFE
jgi:hypothetical protein